MLANRNSKITPAYYMNLPFRKAIDINRLVSNMCFTLIRNTMSPMTGDKLKYEVSSV